MTTINPLQYCSWEFTFHIVAFDWSVNCNCKPHYAIVAELICKLTGPGREYTGILSKTWSGKTCQRWDSQSPHVHSYTDDTVFSDGSVSHANNYCRSPDGDPGGPWCYTTDPDTQLQYCDVPFCPGM